MASAKRRRVATGIYELERGVYELVVSRGRGADGHYRQRTERFRGTLRDAKRGRAALLAASADVAPEPAEPGSSMSFRQLLNLHLERMAAHGHSPRTLEDYGVHIRVHLGPAPCRHCPFRVGVTARIEAVGQMVSRMWVVGAPSKCRLVGQIWSSS